jgi:hypothetical protein
MAKKYNLPVTIIIALIFLLVSGCSAPTPVAQNPGGGGLTQAGPTTGDQTATEAVGCLLLSTPPPYLGLWSLEGEDGPQMLVLTETSFYFVETGKTVSEEGGTRERYAEVTAVDLENSQVTLMTKWIRVNGKMMGFDSPQFFLTYKIEDGMLSFGTSTEGFPTELAYGPFEQK